MRLKFYRLSLERGYLDAAINEYIVRPFVGFFRWCDRMEQKWTGFLSGSPPREPEPAVPPPIELP
jgi:NADH-quinone oxidoreductase subunit L